MINRNRPKHRDALLSYGHGNKRIRIIPIAVDYDKTVVRNILRIILFLIRWPGDHDKKTNKKQPFSPPVGANAFSKRATVK